MKNARARWTYLWEKLATLTIGTLWVSPVASAARKLIDGYRSRPAGSLRAAVVAHAYYPDLIDEILDCHAKFPEGSALILTTPREHYELLARRVRNIPNSEVVSVENRGRDISPFLTLLNAGRLSNYDAVLKIHTKKSPQILDGDIRRKLLFWALAGSRYQVAATLGLFASNKTGIVGWRRSWREKAYFWAANEGCVAELMARIGATPPAARGFFEGSMFWVRPSALERLAALQLSPSMFDEEEGQLDGTLHHCVERVFTLTAHAAGYDVRGTKGELLMAANRRGEISDESTQVQPWS